MGNGYEAGVQNNTGRQRELQGLHGVHRVPPEAGGRGDPRRQPVSWNLNATHCFWIFWLVLCQALLFKRLVRRGLLSCSLLSTFQLESGTLSSRPRLAWSQAMICYRKVLFCLPAYCPLPLLGPELVTISKSFFFSYLYFYFWLCQVLIMM